MEVRPSVTLPVSVPAAAAVTPTVAELPAAITAGLVTVTAALIALAATRSLSW